MHYLTAFFIEVTGEGHDNDAEISDSMYIRDLHEVVGVNICRHIIPAIAHGNLESRTFSEISIAVLVFQIFHGTGHLRKNFVKEEAGSTQFTISHDSLLLLQKSYVKILYSVP